MKKYTNAPLPFMGQKRRFIKQFRQILSQYSDEVTIVDLFGGSGLLSYIAKQAKANAKVVYNDFDNYQQRINHIPATNALLAKINDIVDRLQKKIKLFQIHNVRKYLNSSRKSNKAVLSIISPFRLRFFLP